MLKGLKKIEIFGGKIYHLEFEDQVNLCKSFLRFQERYENVHFRDKVFTLNEFKDWYKKYKNSEVFTYYTDWAGFNMPDTALEAFRDGTMNPLSQLEEKFLNLFKYVGGKFYIIGTHQGEVSGAAAFEHELAHAMFYLFPEYRDRAIKIIEGKDITGLRNLFLNQLACNESVLLDETNAYLSVDSSLLTEYLEPYGVDIKPLEPTMNELTNLYAEYRRKILPD